MSSPVLSDPARRDLVVHDHLLDHLVFDRLAPLQSETLSFRLFRCQLHKVFLTTFFPRTKSG